MFTQRSVFYFCGSVKEDGILGLTDAKARVIPSNTITIDMFGNAFYRPFEYKMVTHARVFSMEFIGREINEQIGLYLVTQFHWLPKAFNYSDMCSFNKIKDKYIILPTLDDLDKNSPYSKEGFVPDFAYMQERIAELEQYLVAAGLNDYELTEEDREALSRYGFGCHQDGEHADAAGVWKAFRAGDLFECSRGTRITKQNRVAGDIPLLTAGVGIGEGVAQYISKTDRMELYENSITIDMFGACFFHDYKHYGDDNIHFLVADEIGDSQKLFITAALHKLLANQFSYGRQFRMNTLETLSVSLPIQTDEHNTPILDAECRYHPDGFIPDWGFMECYIRAIEKLVIADVVRFKDDSLAKTMEIVGHSAADTRNSCLVPMG